MNPQQGKAAEPTQRERLLATPGFAYSGNPIGGGEPAANNPSGRSDGLQFNGNQISNETLAAMAAEDQA